MRPILIAMAIVEAAAAAVWIGTIYVPLPQRYAMLWVAIAIGEFSLIVTDVDWFGYLGIIIIIRIAPRFSKRIGNKLANIFAYYPGIFS
jgi:hypothetical protein